MTIGCFSLLSFSRRGTNNLSDWKTGRRVSLVRYCHFGVSPVNYSDSDSDSKANCQLLYVEAL